MVGYYKSLTDESIYHVYKKGLDLYAQCLQCTVPRDNQPFPIIAHNIQRMINWKSWELITDQSLINELQSNQ